MQDDTPKSESPVMSISQAAEAVRPPRPNLFVRLVVIPLVLVAPFYILPYPAGVLVCLVLATTFVERFLTRSTMALTIIGSLILPFYIGIRGSFPVMVLSLALVYTVYSVLTLSHLAKTRPVKPAHYLSTILLIILLFAAIYTLQFFEWFPSPDWLSRDTVKRTDYRIMERIFEKPLPASFRITQTHYPAYTFPCPDGPLPAEYEVQLPAADYAKLAAGLTLEEQHAQGYDWPGSHHSYWVLEQFGSDLYKQWEQYRFDKERPPFKFPRVFAKKDRTNTWITIDNRTSPTLRVYISTWLPFQARS